jgi:hypothetical protein
VKAEDGSVAAVDLGAAGGDGDGFSELAGASSGMLGQDDLDEAAAALNPGTSAAVLVYENRWAGPFASSIRRSGGQLVANGRVPTQALLAAVEADGQPELQGA